MGSVNIVNAQNECLTPNDFTAVIDANGVATINPEDVVTVGPDCDFTSFTVSPNEFTCDEIGPHTITVTATTASQPTGNYESVALGIWDAYSGNDILSGDINGDGFVDIVSNRGWYRNNSGNSFSRIDINSYDLAGPQLGDLDGDGDLDLIAAHGVYHWNETSGSYQFVQSLSVNMSTSRVTALADFDNDGDLDWYVTTYYWGENGLERLFINDGTGHFTLGNSFAIGAYQMTSAAGDFDEDGEMDVVIAGYYDVYVGINDGAFANGNPVNFNYSSIFTNGNDYIMDVKAEDFNGDGHLDLIFAGYAKVGNDQGLIMMLGNGDGTFQAAQIIEAYGTLTWDIDVNDFEGDGDLDIVTVVNGQNSKLYLNDGTGNFTSSDLPFVGAYWNVMKVKLDDYNNDGVGDYAKSNEALITEWTDGEEITVTANVTVTDPNSVCNTAPEAIAQDITISVDANCEANAVAADVDNGSYDPDDDEITLTISPAGPYALGSTEVTLTVSDGQLSSTATAIITVIDDTAPVITTSGSPITLWPPNHKYATVSLSDFVESVSDNCSGVDANDVVITSVSSDEAENANGNGDGNTVNDIVIAGNCKSVNLRKERSGNGNGRVYTINVELSDAAGNTATASFNVQVPKNKNGNAIDDGAAYTLSLIHI